MVTVVCTAARLTVKPSGCKHINPNSNLDDPPEHEAKLALTLGHHKGVAEHQGVLLQDWVGHSLGHVADHLARGGPRRLHLQALLRLDFMKPEGTPASLRLYMASCTGVAAKR